MYLVWLVKRPPTVRPVRIGPTGYQQVQALDQRSSVVARRQVTPESGRVPAHPDRFPDVRAAMEQPDELTESVGPPHPS